MARSTEVFGSCFSDREHKSHKGLGFITHPKYKLSNIYTAAQLYCCNSRWIILQLNFQEGFLQSIYVILGDWTQDKEDKHTIQTKVFKHADPLLHSQLSLYSSAYPDT